jgi:CubicO group peptidase (beta-lactamase class C family)
MAADDAAHIRPASAWKRGGGLVLAVALSAWAASPRLAVAQAPAPVGSNPAQAAAPSPERLQRLHDYLRAQTGGEGYLGAVSLIAIDGKVADLRAYGHSDLGRRRPMRQDDIFRLYSMSKPITSVAALILLEEGRISLNDPVSRYLPEFADLQRAAGGSADAPQRVALERQPTLRHLFTHTAGFATDASEHPVAAQLLERAAAETADDLSGYVRRVASAPLAEEPGTHFHYDGVNTQVLARVVEVVSGQSLEQFLRARIFQPLRMPDTGFEVAAAQRGRVVDMSTMDGNGGRVRADTDSARTPGVRLTRYDNGAGGLYSTASDYFRFAQLLANGGELDGVRLLSRKTVELMMTDQLDGFDRPLAGPAPGEGFGLGGYVVTDVAARGRLGSPGQFGWSGSASTYFTIDRREGLVAILMAQHLPRDGTDELPRLSVRFFNLVYQSLP